MITVLPHQQIHHHLSYFRVSQFGSLSNIPGRPGTNNIMIYLDRFLENIISDIKNFFKDIFLPVPLCRQRIQEKRVHQQKVSQQQNDAQVVHVPFSWH